MVTTKTTFTRLIGPDTTSKPTEGLLYKKLEHFISTTNSWPRLSTVEKQNISDLISQLSNSVEKAKIELIDALTNISYKFSSLEVDAEQEEILWTVLSEYDKALICTFQRTNAFYENIKTRVS